MADQGIKIVAKDGVHHLAGVLDEFSDFSLLLRQSEPLRLNLRLLTRFNSIGVRNFLRFLTDWGPKAFVYDQCPSEFVDQINMIPALLGTKGQGRVETLFVPYECSNCDNEEEVLSRAEDYRAAAKAGADLPSRTCGKCGHPMTVLMDSFFVFLTR